MDSFVFPGYEDLEISTQIILNEAKARNLEIEILDRSENFIRLKKGNQSEFIKEASKTRLDNYMTFLVMENKTVSKLCLHEAGLRVPLGSSYETVSGALSDFGRYNNIKKVMKPSTTNFGIGISILEPNESYEVYKNKVESTFQFAKSILIEEFLPGPEYRFLVLGDRTVAVCNRVPANVLSDGKHTISDLVDAKNKDPRRGLGHTTPLEKIQKSQLEEDVLAQQGYNWNSIPEAGIVIYLRRNSNISTGGDSLDYTDKVHPEYLNIAARAAASVGAKICGVDIISERIEEAPNPGHYGILEINFNPVLYIHDFPYEGVNRKVGSKVLDLLGF